MTGLVYCSIQILPRSLDLKWSKRQGVVELFPCLSSPVGSRTGARTVGSGGFPTAFAVDLSPAAIVTFPAPATSNAAGRFPALRSPVCLTSRVMRPIKLGTLSARQYDEPDSH